MSLDESETPTESLCPRIHVDSLEMMCKDNKIRTNVKHIPLNKDIKNAETVLYIFNDEFSRGLLSSSGPIEKMYIYTTRRKRRKQEGDALHGDKENNF